MKADIKPIKCLATDSSAFVATTGAANAHTNFIGAFNTVSHDILRNKHRMDSIPWDGGKKTLEKPGGKIGTDGNL